MDFQAKGKCSHFGGPDDMGVSPSEGLAFIYDSSDQPSIFLDYQPSGTTGLARRLNPDTMYLACRWPYTADNKAEWRELLLGEMALVRAPSTGKSIKVWPADWGPAGPESDHDTGRVADLSPAAMEYLQIATDSEVEIVFPFTHRREIAEHKYKSIVISSGHGIKVRGASGLPEGLEEVDEAIRVMNRVAELLKTRGVQVKTFTDSVSTSQNENLHRITDYHNAQSRDLDISVHFNAYQFTPEGMGTEVLWVTQQTLATELSAAIASGGLFKNRGAKKRTDLWFLNQTTMPSVLLEVCFVDSLADSDLYRERFEDICGAIVNVLAPKRKPLTIGV